MDATEAGVARNSDFTAMQVGFPPNFPRSLANYIMKRVVLVAVDQQQAATDNTKVLEWTLKELVRKEADIVHLVRKLNFKLA